MISMGEIPSSPSPSTSPRSAADLSLLHLPFLLSQVAKGNTDASLGNRASAAVDAAGDKMDESKSGASAELNKEKAKN